MEVRIHAGKPAEPEMLVDVPKLVTAYYTETAHPSIPAQRVSFGCAGYWYHGICKWLIPESPIYEIKYLWPTQRRGRVFTCPSGFCNDFRAVFVVFRYLTEFQTIE